MSARAVEILVVDVLAFASPHLYRVHTMKTFSQIQFSGPSIGCKPELNDKQSHMVS